MHLSLRGAPDPSDAAILGVAPFPKASSIPQSVQDAVQH
jgi:hypothetical protein